MLGKIATALETNATLRAWKSRYRIHVEMRDNEFAVHFAPMPPDTFDSIREEIAGHASGCPIDAFHRELTDQGLSVFVDFEKCSWGGETFTIFIAPIPEET